MTLVFFLSPLMQLEGCEIKERTRSSFKEKVEVFRKFFEMCRKSTALKF